MEIKRNVLLILKESYKWRNRELLEPATGFVDINLSKTNFLKNNALLFVCAFTLSLGLHSYINEAFAGYLISSLSIFIGLFTSVLILVFDKYLNQKKEFDQSGITNSNVVLQQKKLQNFSRQFVFISLESLLIAVTLIAFLLLPLIFKENYTTNVCDSYFVKFNDWDFKGIKIFIKNFIFVLSRAIIILLLYKFIKYLFYIFGSLGSFLKGVFDNHVRL